MWNVLQAQAMPRKLVEESLQMQEEELVLRCRTFLRL
jgi:hypothetical protein